MKRTSLFLLLLISFADAGFSIDKEKIEIHLRKALNLDTRAAITLGDPAPDKLGGLMTLPVLIGPNTYYIYLTPDEKKYIWGQVFDATIDPDKARLGSINLKDVYAQGSPAAPVTIVEYSDLQCPHCSKAHEVLSDQLYKNYTKDQVRWIFKHYPLQGHEWAEAGAIATECAGQQNPRAFWDLTEKFFHNASTITVQNIGEKAMQFASQSKLDTKRFKQCFDSKATMDRVQAHKREGNAAGVAATPTIFVNGRMKRGFRDFEDVKVLIEEKLGEAQKK